MRVISGREVKVPSVIQMVLGANETVLHSYEQASLTGKFGGAGSLYVTNRRIIVYKPRTFGLRANIVDFRYKDIANVGIKKGFTRSDIAIRIRFGGEEFAIRSIPNEGAAKMFGTIQSGVDGDLKILPTTNITTTEASDDVKELFDL